MKQRRKRSEAGGVAVIEPEKDFDARVDAIVERGAERLTEIVKSAAEKIAEERPSAKEIVDTSRALRDEVHKAEDEERKLRFKTVQRARDPLRKDLGQIVETHWIVDLYATWNRIRGVLKIGEKRSEHGHVILALDEARGLAEEAYGLVVTAKL